MADEPDATAPDAPADPPAKKGSLLSTLLGIAAVTVLAAGGGVLLGFQVHSLIEVAAKKKLEASDGKTPGAYTGTFAVKTIPPVITNLAQPQQTWLRIEASLIFEGEMPPDADALAAQVSGDYLAFLRTVSLAQIQGAAGLVHLREDLTERAKTRSGGRVRELVIQALAIE
ncbi:flagellar basal body-associated FliL family protein [soil metagenome]